MHNHVAGVEVPDALIARMERAADRKAEGRRIAIELVAALRAIPGIHGVHLQAIEAEDQLPEVIREAGLLPRPETG